MRPTFSRGETENNQISKQHGRRLDVRQRKQHRKQDSEGWEQCGHPTHGGPGRKPDRRETATAILAIWRAEAVARTESSRGGQVPDGLQAQGAASAAAAAGGTWEMESGGGAPHHRGPQRWHERLGFTLRGELTGEF